MKNRRIGIEVPAVTSPVYDGPTELRWAAGTNTLYLPCRIQVEERLLLGDRVVGASCTVRGGKVRRRRAPSPSEHLVPHPVGPAVDAAVAGEELLLAAVGDRAGRLVVGDEAAADVLRTGRCSSPSGRGCRW